MSDKRQFVKGIFFGCILALVLGAIIFSLGNGSGWNSSTQSTNGEINLITEEIEEKLTNIQTVLNQCYTGELDQEQIEEYLIKGAVVGVGDPYTVYYTADEYTALMDSTSGSYYGIGVEMSQSYDTGIVTITRVFGEPSIEAGLLPGDILVGIDGFEVTGEDLSQAIVTKIKGEEGTSITLSVLREDEILEIEVERRYIEVDSVEWVMLENKIGYINITAFEGVTAEQFKTALQELEEGGMESLVIDLRNNGGGLVDAATEILDELLPEGLLVYVEDKYGNREEYFSDDNEYFDEPMVVLVNGNSASASEIFAGAMKDYEAATIIGTQTFGKGIVQQIIPFEDGTALKVTMAKYYTPNGNYIHEVGIEPDIEIELEEGLESLVEIPVEDDNQLQKAMEILSK